MSRWEIGLETMLQRYIFGEKYDKNFPLALKKDVLVRYVIRMIKRNTCPFCGRMFMNGISIRSHLTHGDHPCRRMFNEFIRLTVQRYILLKSDVLRKEVRKIEDVEVDEI